MRWKDFVKGLWPIRNYYLKPPTIGLFYYRVVFDFALENPELLSLARILERFGIYRHNKKLTNVSGRFRQIQNHRFAVDLKILRSYDYNSLSWEDKISFKVLEWYLDNERKRKAFLFHDYPVNQLSGVHKELPNFMLTIHQLTTPRDARHYIQRLKAFRSKLKQVIRRMQKAAKQGIYPPRFVVEKVIAELDSFVKVAYEEHTLYTNFRSRLLDMQTLTPARANRYCERVAHALEEHVYPAYQELRTYFNQLLQKVSDDDGVWKLPDGDRYYEYILQSHLTVNLTPEMVHETGKKEQKRIVRELISALEEVGENATEETLGEVLIQLGQKAAFQYQDNAVGRHQCLEEIQEMVEQATAQITSCFHYGAEKMVKVERLPRYKEPTSPEAYYEPPSYGDDRPGTFFVNMGRMNKLVRWALPTLVYHETVPGHHLQVVRQMALEDVPFFRKIIPFTAYVEGWALYAERLAHEKGWLKDAYANIGRLQSELLRALRLVVDTGIHWKRWTRQQAIAYMNQYSGLTHASVIAEVERYIVDPGQACAYKIGELHLLALRQRVQDAMGDDFDEKEWHDLVLSSGSVPLPVLDLIVDHYLSTTGYA